MLINVGRNKILVFDGPSLNAICIEEITNLPADLSVVDGTLRLFVERQAMECGLKAVPHKNVNYAFDLK